MEKIIEKYTLFFLNIIFSTFLIYGPKLYYTTKQPIFLILTVITTNILIFVLYSMIKLKYSLIQVSITGKILPVIILSFLSFFVINQ